jgi:hypothetical protein
MPISVDIGSLVDACARHRLVALIGRTRIAVVAVNGHSSRASHVRTASLGAVAQEVVVAFGIPRAVPKWATQKRITRRSLHAQRVVGSVRARSIHALIDGAADFIGAFGIRHTTRVTPSIHGQSPIHGQTRIRHSSVRGRHFVTSAGDAIDSVSAYDSTTFRIEFDLDDSCGATDKSGMNHTAHDE